MLDPLGVPERHWSIGYGRAYEVDGLKLYANWGGATFTARAAARIGQLMMLQGQWNGRELIRRDVVKTVLTDQGLPRPARSAANPSPASGLAWYTNTDGIWPAAPRDTFAGAGAQHQVIVVAPSLDLIVVRNGDALGDTASGFWGPVYDLLVKPLMESVSEKAPYPPSPVIRRVVFAKEIRRSAIDSDNWPLTWGDDDTQYTSYGDGFGFEPHVEKKLGMGFARITGGPGEYRGVNLRSDGEQTGNGAKSPKASGILMVDGVLYLWVRNVGNAQLLWSRDRGKTWQSGFKMETAFGSPAFLNFGRNYAGARDAFVYTYSQDGPVGVRKRQRSHAGTGAEGPHSRSLRLGILRAARRRRPSRMDAGRRAPRRRLSLSRQLPAGRRGVQRRHRPVSVGIRVRSCGRLGTLRRA